MKRFFALPITVFALVAMAQSSFGGPEPISSKEMKQVAPAPVPFCDWTGLYIGIHGGWRGGETEWQRPDDTKNAPGDLAYRDYLNGGFGGLTLGYNRQFGQWLVLGIELTGSYGSPDENVTRTEPFDLDVKHYGTQYDWSGTVGLRAGWTSFDNKLLIYSKVGVAASHWSYDYVNDETLDNGIQPEFDRWSEDETRVFPFVGFGVEYAFNCRWSAKIEWDHLFLGTHLVTGVLHEDPNPFFTDTNDPHHGYYFDNDQDNIYVGLNYKFWGGSNTPSLTLAGVERLEAKEIAPAPPPCDWTGFYVGIHGGWRGGETEWARTDDLKNSPGDLAYRDYLNGGFGGLTLGYNRQFGQWWMLGIELTGSYGSPDDNVNFSERRSSDINHYGTQNDWSGTFALRAGFTSLNNRMLTYFKAGGAVSHWNYHYLHDESLNSGVPEFDRWNEDETRVVPLFGFGSEYAFNCHWSVKIEWNRLFLGSHTINGVLHEDPNPFGPDLNDPHHAYQIDHSQDNIFVGLNYKF